jgi:hypothetical protein
MTVWLDMSCDTTMMETTLSLLAEILIDRLCNFKVIILTQQSSYLLEINVFYGSGHIYQKKVLQYFHF